jgi:hypothetical protein
VEDKMTIKIVTEHNRAISYTTYRAGKPFTYKCDMANADVWIDCKTCDLSIGARSDSDFPISDKDFIDLVRREGWAFIPGKHIACPECRKNKKKPQ